MRAASNDAASAERGLSRRRILSRASIALAAAGAAAAGLRTGAGAQPATPLPPEIEALRLTPRYQHASWGLLLIDLASGAVVYSLNPNLMFIPGSTTKLYTTSTALDAYGADYRFETPVYRTGALGPGGELNGNLVLVASGDPTMGGRDTPSGHIDFRSIDHINANALGDAELTPENPVAGLDELGRQVAASGVRRVHGTVVIDDRLWPTIPKDDFFLTPIMINDNLIDLTIAPKAVGETATVAWRPQSAAYHVRSEAKTVPANQPALLTVTTPGPGRIVVQGQIPAGKPLVQTSQVTDPAAFARTLFIEALQRRGVSVDGSAVGPNPTAQLPPRGSYTADERVALLRSLPFSEVIRLVLKVSHNQIADTLIELIALKHGKVAFEAGMSAILPFLKKAGVADGGVSLGDGRGNDRADVFTPSAVASLLRYMSTRPDFPAFHNGLPVLGVDGTEFAAVPPTSPARGKASVKTGAVVVADLLHDRPLQTAASMAGYLTGKSGKPFIGALYINNIVLNDVSDVFAVDRDMGSVYAAMYSHL